MKDLYSFLDEISQNSSFNAQLSKRGGFITFSNSGRRGGVKYFQIGLDSILQTLKDILDNLTVFNSLTEYEEKAWRDNGSEFFNDPVANANSTVQTKPLFSTLSKVIIWGNQPRLDDINPDDHIALDELSLKTAINKLEVVANSFSPNQITKHELPLQIKFNVSPNKDLFLPYLTALRTKPFMLLAGISGTGKSRIVRELAKACWKEGDEEYGKNCPKNFCMVQVKPNWHDSTELFGYVSRISGKPEFVAGDFMKFVIKAWENPDVPYFLCLDEMNLAPVEQYFAEYLSVIESRKSDGGIISTDPIFKKPFEDKIYDDAIDYEEGMDWYQKFIVDHTSNKDLRQQFYKNGITIPNNLFVIGTVNMDETTFSFSRKVLDRAMTLEMNEVDLYGGLEENGSEIGYIGNCIIGNAAEGKDIYADNKELCDKVISYLEKVNAILDKTPFKVAYRTRNEFILYAVNRQLLDDKSQLWQTLDEMTSMKILSRIEGDSDRTQKVLEDLKQLIDTHITNAIPESEDGNSKPKSISAAKIEEMLDKLNKTSFTSYWT